MHFGVKMTGVTSSDAVISVQFDGDEIMEGELLLMVTVCGVQLHACRLVSGC